jgi:hypothetical protein
MTEILVVGFTKSGNTWLSRLLSDALDWPVRGINGARPLSEQGEDHRDGHVIRQLHLYPDASGSHYSAVPHQYTLNTDKVTEHHKIVHIIRDPRDVAVAINYYWGIKNLQRVITKVMATGEHPLWGCGWVQYVEAWRTTHVPVVETRYEWLHADTLLELQRILDRFELRAVKPLGEVIERQSIDVKRKDIVENGEHLAHGKGAQLTNLRAGRVGDWRQEFSEEDIEAFADLYTMAMLKLSYEDDPEWYLRKAQT